jgi:hypothetical protein
MGAIRMKVRGFKSGRLLWAEDLVFAEVELERLLPALAQEHIDEIKAGRLGMIELEFLDEPDPMQRFFRIGVEQEGMVVPIRIDLDKGPTQ